MNCSTSLSKVLNCRFPRNPRNKAMPISLSTRTIPIYQRSTRNTPRVSCTKTQVSLVCPLKVSCYMRPLNSLRVCSPWSTRVGSTRGVRALHITLRRNMTTHTNWEWSGSSRGREGRDYSLTRWTQRWMSIMRRSETASCISHPESKGCSRPISILTMLSAASLGHRHMSGCPRIRHRQSILRGVTLREAGVTAHPQYWE